MPQSRPHWYPSSHPASPCVQCKRASVLLTVCSCLAVTVACQPCPLRPRPPSPASPAVSPASRPRPPSTTLRHQHLWYRFVLLWLCTRNTWTMDKTLNSLHASASCLIDAWSRHSHIRKILGNQPSVRSSHLCFWKWMSGALLLMFCFCRPSLVSLWDVWAFTLVRWVL